MSKLLTLMAVPVVQGDVTFYQTSLPAADLLDESKFQIDRWNNATERGYQREVNDPHARRIAMYLKGKVVEDTNLMPSPIVINVRGALRTYDQGNGLIKVEVPADEVGYIVDGQHRMDSIKKVIEDNPETLADYSFGIVLTNLTLEQEMIQFKNLNSTANRPAKGLGQVIGHQLQQIGGYMPPTFNEQATNAAVAMTIRLTTDINSPFYGKIAIGGIRKRSFHTTVQSVMVSALLPLYMGGRFSDLTADPDKNYQYVLEFCRAVEKTWPEATANPESYAIQRSVGIQPLIKVLIKIFNNISVNPTYETFKTVLDEIRTSLGIDDAAWAMKPQAKLNAIRAGYTMHKGNGLIADYMWTGVDTSNFAKV